MPKDVFTHLDEIESEWERPFGERLLKIAVVAFATLGANMLIEALYDKIRDRNKDEDTEEQQSPTE